MVKSYTVVYALIEIEGRNYLNVWHWTGSKKNELSSQFQCPIYCMPNKMHTLLRYQSCYATNLPSKKLKTPSDKISGKGREGVYLKFLIYGDVENIIANQSTLLINRMPSHAIPFDTPLTVLKKLPFLATNFNP